MHITKYFVHEIQINNTTPLDLPQIIISSSIQKKEKWIEFFRKKNIVTAQEDNNKRRKD